MKVGATLTDMRAIKPIYYGAAIAFHLILFLTDAGNYFHDGTLAELVTLQVCAVLISLMAIKLLPTVRGAEKVLVVLCALVPIIFIVTPLLSLIGR